VLTPVYKDIPVYLSLIIIVNEKFVFHSEYSFDISLIKTILDVNDCKFFPFDRIGGN
jgi:hypothetical protein